MHVSGKTTWLQTRMQEAGVEQTPLPPLENPDRLSEVGPFQVLRHDGFLGGPMQHSDVLRMCRLQGACQQCQWKSHITKDGY